ncbi:hypothetical protein CR513_33205, partial [Mucuna pruriens]
MSLFSRESEIKKTFFSNQPMLVLLYNEACLNSKIDPSSFPTSIISLLQDFQDVFLNEVLSDLPPNRGIEHHIDLILGAALSYACTLDFQDVFLNEVLSGLPPNRGIEHHIDLILGVALCHTLLPQILKLK